MLHCGRIIGFAAKLVFTALLITCFTLVGLIAGCYHALFTQGFVSAVEEHPSNPTLAAVRKLTYQLVLKTKVRKTFA